MSADFDGILDGLDRVAGVGAGSTIEPPISHRERRTFRYVEGVKSDKSEPSSLAYGILFLVAGVLMTLLPIVTWPNSKLFAVLYLPGLLMGPFLVIAAISSFRDALSSGE